MYKVIFSPLVLSLLMQFANQSITNINKTIVLQSTSTMSSNSIPIINTNRNDASETFLNCQQDKEFTNEPRNAKFHTNDVISFWQIFDQHNPKIDAAIIEKEYLEKGSIGLKAFIKNRIESGKYMSKIVNKNIDYYKYIRPYTLTIEEKRKHFYKHFEKLKLLYPEAIFPDVYFVIGANNTGGATFKGGLIIGLERFGKSNENFNPALDIEELDNVIIHELIHFQQKYTKDNSLLAQSIKEGAADLICEMITGSHSNKKLHLFANEHKNELWTEFKSKMYDTNWTNWLYGGNKIKSRPKDLGYWMGYEICKAYYNKSTDKKKAISEILNIRDFKNFLEESNYN